VEVEDGEVAPDADPDDVGVVMPADPDDVEEVVPPEDVDDDAGPVAVEDVVPAEDEDVVPVAAAHVPEDAPPVRRRSHLPSPVRRSSRFLRRSRRLQDRSPAPDLP